jgi:TRAP-type C4-dicarboxylate transport system permease large subunit
VINSLAKEVPLWTIYRGVMPFILADFVRLAILAVFPSVSLVLPGMMD